jgi:hypothetical protein
MLDVGTDTRAARADPVAAFRRALGGLDRADYPLGVVEVPALVDGTAFSLMRGDFAFRRSGTLLTT